MLVMEANVGPEMTKKTQKVWPERQEENQAREGVPEAGRSQRAAQGLLPAERPWVNSFMSLGFLLCKMG